MSQSPFQRFIAELRRRHVPQMAAIYLVAAWAAIEFADVVVPNLNGPQWMVTAVIVAALVGFPVVLVVAWIFEWGPDGIYRTEDPAVERMEAPPSYDPDTGGTKPAPGHGGPRTGPPTRSQPWLAVLAVLVVGIGSAVGVAYVLRGGGSGDGSGEATAPAIGDREPEALGDREGAEGVQAGADVQQPPVPPTPGMGELGDAFADSVGRRIFQALSTLDTMDLSGMAELRHMAQLGGEAAADAGLAVLIIEPTAWRGGDDTVPVQLAEGDTLRIRGVAVDSAGVVSVAMDGETVAQAEQPAESVPFTAAVVGREGVGLRPVVITVRTTDGRELGRTFQIVQMPGGTP